jgi:phage baseplate assembly protein V
MTHYDFFRMIKPYARKIWLMIGRGIITGVDNSKKYQRVALTALKDEVITDVERPQPYGLDTYPPNDSEATILFPNGERDRGLVICIGNIDYRPTTKLQSGEVMVYDKDQNHVHLKTGNVIEIKTSDGSTITLDSNGIIIDAKKVTLASNLEISQ